VTLVGVLNADQGLFGTDPRSHERLAQTILQVAGRAGRADRPGEVVIQTHYPDHPLLTCLLTARLWRVRDARAGRTPGSALAAVLASRVWHAEAAKREPAFALLERVRVLAGGGDADTAVTVLGPAAQTMERKDGRYRVQLLFRSAQRAALHRLVDRVLLEIRASAEARHVRWSVDIDPLEI